MTKIVQKNMPDFTEWEARKMQEPEFVAAAAELEPGFQVARLRILRGLTQAQLAEMVGTRQPSIARLENGSSSPSLSFLKKIASALHAKIEIKISVEEPSLVYKPSRLEVKGIAENDKPI